MLVVRVRGGVHCARCRLQFEQLLPRSGCTLVGRRLLGPHARGNNVAPAISTAARERRRIMVCMRSLGRALPGAECHADRRKAPNVTQVSAASPL